MCVFCWQSFVWLYVIFYRVFVGIVEWFVQILSVVKCLVVQRKIKYNFVWRDVIGYVILNCVVIVEFGGVFVFGIFENVCLMVDCGVLGF